MTDLARHHAKTKKRGASAGLVFALLVLVVLIVGAAALVALMLWPRWPGTAVAPDAPSLPVTIGGVLFNVPPAAIRIPAQRHSGAQERVDLAFMWPSLAPPDANAKLAPSEGTPPIDRLFVTLATQSPALPPAERVKSIYPRYLGEVQFDGPDGLKVISFKDGTPYQGEDLFFDSSAAAGLRRALLAPGRCRHAGHVSLRAAHRRRGRDGALPERLAHELARRE